MTSPVQSRQIVDARKIWADVAPYATSSAAASFAIVFAFRGLMAKSYLQQGMNIPKISLLCGLKEGLKASPKVGSLIGAQMGVQNFVQKFFPNSSHTNDFWPTIASSAFTGTASSPFLAILNGLTLKQTVWQSFRNFSLKQGAAISVQETAFIAGLSLADKVAFAMRHRFGDSSAVDYSAAFISGAAGSLAGHPANTALTRWQRGLKIENMSQLMWGGATKARAIGLFAMAYMFAKKTLESSV